MGSITIHTLDAELELRLTEEARRRKTSKNKLVKELLARSLGMPAKGRFADDYREFCETWTSEERTAFEKSQTENSRVDAGDWRE